jgi:predicted dinucleotide-binding enzyme
VRGEPAKAREVLEKIEGVRDVREASNRQDVVLLEVRWTQKADTAAGTEQAVHALVEAGLKLREVAPTKASLEDVFALLTEEEQQEADESEASDASTDSDRGEASP